MKDKLDREIRLDEERYGRGSLKWFKQELVPVAVEREQSREVQGPSIR